MESTLTNFEKFHPPQKEDTPSTFIAFMKIFHPPRLLQPPRLHYLIFSAPFFTVYKQFNDSFLTEMKLIQEIRLELVSLDPFLLCKYVLRWFLKKKSTLHIYWFFKKIPASMVILISTFIDFAIFAPPPRLFQPPRLLETWEYIY